MNVLCWSCGNNLFFPTCELRTQLVGDSSGDVGFDRKDIRQFSIKGVGPEVGIVGCFDQLHVYTHCVAAFLHTTFQDVGDAKLLRNLSHVVRSTFVILSGRPRNYLQIGNLG